MTSYVWWKIEGGITVTRNNLYLAFSLCAGWLRSIILWWTTERTALPSAVPADGEWGLRISAAGDADIVDARERGVGVDEEHAGGVQGLGVGEADEGDQVAARPGSQHDVLVCHGYLKGWEFVLNIAWNIPEIKINFIV